MANALIWSERALYEYDALQLYLFGEWGEQITERVTAEIAQTITRIQNSPEHFPFYKKRKKIRRCVASPQTSIYFIFDGGLVEIVSVFDNRQNPRKRKL